MPMKPVILLLGGSGQIGAELFPLLETIGKVFAPSHRELDLHDLAKTRRFIRSIQPTIIVNTAAYTAVDAAEADETSAEILYAQLPLVLAEAALTGNSWIIHYSTDYVFDGTKSSPYDEGDRANPLNVYGKTKLAGEQGIRGTGVPHLIFRTSWVYATHGKNFLRTILRLATERQELTVVSDQTGAPTCAFDVALGTLAVLKRILVSGEDEPLGVDGGTYHMTAAGSTTWFQFASLILETAVHFPTRLDWLAETTKNRPFVTQRVVPTSTASYGAAARRPLNSVLSSAKLAKTFGVSLPDWRDQLRGCFKPQTP